MVIFDIGHGNDTYKKTGGKGVPGLEEFNFNQAVVKYAKELAEYNGIKVFLTQPFDSPEVPLHERSNYANNTNANLLISFHANASGEPNASGHMAFYWHTSKNGKMLAEIWNKHAKELPNKELPITPCVPGTWTNFHIVRETKMPAVLLEHAFMTNTEDLKLLQSDSFRRICAKVAVKAVCEYLGIAYKEPTEEQEIKVDIKDFQRMTGLVADGIIGPKTRSKAEEIKRVCEYILNCGKPATNENTQQYERQGLTDIAWIDPMALRFAKVNMQGNAVISRYKSFVNAMFYGEKDGKILTVGTGYSEGKKVTTRLPWDNVARGTFIVHKDGRVTVEQLIDPDKKYNDIWFCVQGVGLNPIDLKAEWQPESIGRVTNRVMLGYNPQRNKIAITFRPDSDIQRGRQTLINLGCEIGIGLDSGTPATMVQHGKVIRLADYLDNIIYW